MSPKILALTTLLAVAAARPTLSPRLAASTNCQQTNPGTTFYSCTNGYTGCFTQNPCSLPSRAIPATITTSSPSPSPTPSTHEHTHPRSFNIYVLNQHNVQDPVPHIDLNKPPSSPPTTTNALVFDDVPPGAKNCRLNWRTTTANDTNTFFVKGSGQAWHRQLNGFPTKDEVVSYDGLKKYQVPGREWSQSLDFTGWEGMPGMHVGSGVECGGQVAVELKGSAEGEGENRVFLSLEGGNGVFLTYEV